jgi:hypothetical protein
MEAKTVEEAVDIFVRRITRPADRHAFIERAMCTARAILEASDTWLATKP